MKIVLPSNARSTTCSCAPCKIALGRAKYQECLGLKPKVYSLLSQPLVGKRECLATAATVGDLLQSEAALTIPATGVRIQDVVKNFTTRKGVSRAIKGVSVDIPAGAITALLGPSGGGKTTLLRLIAGLELPTSGRIIINGVDVTDQPVQDRDIGIVFQGYALFKHMTVAENVEFGLKMKKITPPQGVKKRVEELLELVELSHTGARFPTQLSGGQRQRIALARALACNPNLLLLDEPFGALDPVVRASLRNGLKEIVRKLGITTIMVTHDQEEAWEMADNVIIVRRGLLQQQGTPAQIADTPANPFVKNFVGDILHFPANSLFVRKMGLATKLPAVMLQPKDLEISCSYEGDIDSGDEGSLSWRRQCPATIIDRHHSGYAVHYYLKFDDDLQIEIIIDAAYDLEHYDFAVGQRIYLRTEAAKLLPFSFDEIGA